MDVFVFLHFMFFLSFFFCFFLFQRVSELEGEMVALKESSRAALLAHKATESKLRLQVCSVMVCDAAMFSVTFCNVL